MVNFTVTGQGLPHPAAWGAALSSLGFDTRGQVIRGLNGPAFGAGGVPGGGPPPLPGTTEQTEITFRFFAGRKRGSLRRSCYPGPLGPKPPGSSFSPSAERLYALSDQGYLRISDGGISPWTTPPASGLRRWRPMSPLVTGASPAGGGTALEQVNRLDEPAADLLQRRWLAAYRLPEEAVGVAVQVSGKPGLPGSFDAEPGLYRTPPAAGTDNVRDHLAASSDRARVLGMPGVRNLQRNTDTRLFHSTATAATPAFTPG